MITKNVTTVKECIKELAGLKNSMTGNLKEVAASVSNTVDRLAAILEEEEVEYVKTQAAVEVVAIYDEKLNALFEAIGTLDQKFASQEQVCKTIDFVTELLRIATE